jgi:hypothetical protein
MVLQAAGYPLVAAFAENTILEHRGEYAARAPRFRPARSAREERGRGTTEPPFVELCLLGLVGGTSGGVKGVIVEDLRRLSLGTVLRGVGPVAAADARQ